MGEIAWLRGRGKDGTEKKFADGRGDGMDSIFRNFNFLMFFLDLLRLRLFLIFLCADGLAKQNHNISKGEKDAPTLGRSRRSQEIPLF